ncbi:MAG TPA: hypothetical protein VFU15_00735 [Bacteroidia bacterium]|nr:hypothetical protein [Bacteroidia bacterium]
MKKLIYIGLWIVAFAGAIVTMSFASRSHAARKCGKLYVDISPPGNHFFIRPEDIRELLSAHAMMPEGKSISDIDVNGIEKLLLTHPAVESCDAFISIDGNVTVKIRQRNPVMRFMNYNGESYYMDDKGKLMPWSEEYTAPLILVSGYFGDGYAAMQHIDFSKISADSALKTPTVLDDAWQIVRKLEADSFLTAQITQVFISPDEGIQLIPRIGSQSIVIGDIRDLDDKLYRLRLFYREGLGKTGSWNDYSKIDLQYKNQIVCTKKNNDHGQ